VRSSSEANTFLTRSTDPKAIDPFQLAAPAALRQVAQKLRFEDQSDCAITGAIFDSRGPERVAAEIEKFCLSSEISYDILVVNLVHRSVAVGAKQGMFPRKPYSREGV
jgi:hypothetical protein